ncbi:MAG: tripartite tricarboxylate transporter substrate binding protein, partial [Burkholderiaceae bacterium]|nr:tripartite tricarboxylate transporter substrate binding protein [Burkholderiaceae bacterium]
WLGGTLLAAAAPLASAQSAYPGKPVKLIVTYTAGGANDLTARIYADLLTARFKQAFVVENRPGASGITGTGSVASSEADGYTLLLGAGGTMTINPALFENLPYDPLRDFAPIGLAAQAPLVVVVPPSLPVHSIKELIEYAKSRPEGISFATPGLGTPLHLAAELFMRQAQIKSLHVPYRGSAPALADLTAGRVDVMFDVQGSSLQFIQSGRLRALAVTSLKRSAYLPDVPTLHESALKNFDVTTWFGLFAPAKTPSEIINQLSRALQAMAQTREAEEKLAPLGMSPAHSTPDGLRELVSKEQAKWREIIKVAHIKAE